MPWDRLAVTVEMVPAWRVGVTLTAATAAAAGVHVAARRRPSYGRLVDSARLAAGGERGNESAAVLIKSR